MECTTHHFDHYECSKCGNILNEPIICYWSKKDLEEKLKKTPKWKYCPFCGEKL